MKNIFRRAIAVIALVLFGCDPSVPEGRVMVKNDSQDREYNVIQVSASGSSYTLKPGEHVLLPKGASLINFSRKYKDFTRLYTVECPSRLKKGAVLKLIDVHLNRMQGGCKTIRASP